ncbi:MAG: SurA N-terminal domain-containing protein, partial [Terricaulis sp.]
GLDFGGNNAVATVGGRSITPPQLTREIELTLRGERQNGNNLSQQDAIDQGIHRNLLERMINRVAMYVYADKIGVSASDTQVRNRIADIPAVHNAVTGAFDQTAYASFLNEMRYTQSEFERDVRGDLTTAMVVQSLMAGVRAPSSFGALTYAYDAETRVVSLLEVPVSAVGAIPQPNDAQVQAFYEDSQQQLRLPEFRVLTLVYARPSDFAARVQVPEERIREDFDARAPQMTRPETRSGTTHQSRRSAGCCCTGHEPSDHARRKSITRSGARRSRRGRCVRRPSTRPCGRGAQHAVAVHRRKGRRFNTGRRAELCGAP